MKLSFIRNILLIVSLIFLSFAVGFRIGGSNLYNLKNNQIKILNRNPTQVNQVDFSLFWNVWEKLEKYYFDQKELDPQKMVYGAISGMVQSLGDPYTVFLPPDQNKEIKDDLGGKFEGIGAQLGVKDKKIVVIAPLKGAPAEAAGLKPGDWIVKVDGKETVNWTLPEAVSKIRGPKGTKVNLTILSIDETKPVDFEVVRDEIKVASVEWSKEYLSCDSSKSNCHLTESDCENCLFFVNLKLGRFGDTTQEEWTKAVDEIKSLSQESLNKKPGLVLDMRNNPGGYLSGSVFIASEFLKDGVVVIQENSKGNKQTYTASGKGSLFDIPMVVLVNKGSASASEIVAGALQSRKRAKVVGENSFGKGSIQEAQELEGGAGIHITTAKWLLPNGKWINGDGITPDVAINNDDTKPDEDLQLIKAAELFL